uniref:Uncharacterized protein n=1 Tax=Oryza meridionalis TaxID=40149 RepID=A0A0E0CUU4_9ORYZ
MVPKEKTFGELGMASVNSPGATAWIGEARRIEAVRDEERETGSGGGGRWVLTARGERGRGVWASMGGRPTMVWGRREVGDDQR